MLLNEMLKRDIDIHTSVLGTSWSPFRELFHYITEASPQALLALLSIIQVLQYTSTVYSRTFSLGFIFFIFITESPKTKNEPLNCYDDVCSQSV